MKELLTFVQENLELALLVVDALLVILSVIAIHKISKTKRMIDHVTGAVENYLQQILSEEEQEKEPVLTKEEREKRAKAENPSKDEEQNRLISAVLQEIFP